MTQATLLPGWKLLRLSVGFWRRHWRLWLKVGLVALGVSLIFSSQTTSEAYGNIWFALVLCGQLWLVRRLFEDKPATVRAVYYEGTASLVRLVLVLMVQFVYLLPLFGGLFAAGAIAAQQVSSLSREIAAGLVLLILALVSGYLSIRSLYAPILALQQNPLAAVRGSWRQTKRKVLALVLRLLWWWVPASLLLGGLLGLGFLFDVSLGLSQLMLQSLLYLIVTPSYVIYLYHLYYHDRHPG